MFVSPSPAAQPPPASSPAPPPNASSKLKRRPAGTPDPAAEVVALSPRTLLESDRYVCEICNQGFQRDQNLQMHRRRHKVPWKLLKRESGGEARKRVFVCPESSCLHHDPAHALGDLVGIKKHFRRKHSGHKQWACARCSKAYAVHSDYKAHLKTCGTRGHSCDCGRVFSRVESFIEHQDTCNAGRAVAPELAAAPPPACISRRASSSSMWPALRLQTTSVAAGGATASYFLQPDHSPSSQIFSRSPLVELQLLPAMPGILSSFSPSEQDSSLPENLELTIGPSRAKDEEAAADAARQQAKRQLELAEQDFGNAKRIRQQAQTELNKAFSLRERATKRIHSTLLQITCFSCRQQFFSKPNAAATLIADEHSVTASYISSVMTEAEDDGLNLDLEREPKDLG